MNGVDHHDGSVAEEAKPKSLPKKALDAVLWFCQDQWFLLGIIFVIIISSQVQVPASQQATKQVVVSYLASEFTIGCTDGADKSSNIDLLHHRMHAGYQDPAR